MKHLSTRRKRHYPPSSGERNGDSLNRVGVIAGRRFRRGVVGPSRLLCRGDMELQSRRLAERAWKGRPKKVTALYATGGDLHEVLPSTTEHVEFCGNPGGPSSKAKYSW